MKNKIEKEKIPVIIELHNYELVRENDGLIKRSQDIKWIEWDEEGRAKELYNNIAIGRSLLMSPFNAMFTWQTTAVTEILEEGDVIKFKTENSIYTLKKLI
jgi:hypothetical protein